MEDAIAEALKARLSRKGRYKTCMGLVKTLEKAAGDVRAAAAAFELNYKYSMGGLDHAVMLLRRSVRALRRAIKSASICKGA